MNRNQIERKSRVAVKTILESNGIDAEVESVAWIDRGDEKEFAAIKIWSDDMDQYDSILEILTAPGFPVQVTRERTSPRYHFIYVSV